MRLWPTWHSYHGRIGGHVCGVSRIVPEKRVVFRGEYRWEDRNCHWAIAGRHSSFSANSPLDLAGLVNPAAMWRLLAES